MNPLRILDRIAAAWLEWRSKRETARAFAAMPPEERDIGITGVHQTKDGSWLLGLSLPPPIVGIVSRLANDMLRADKIVNYLVWNIVPTPFAKALSDEYDDRPIEITMRWADHGESPAQQNMRLKREIEELKARLEPSQPHRETP